MNAEPKEIVETFLRSATIPLLYHQDGANHAWASGTLFKIADRHFIVTARHIFDGIYAENLGYPEHRDVGGRTRTIGKARIAKPDTDEIDVAVVELYDDKTKQALSSGWTFLSLDHVAQPSSNDGLFALMGYPSSISVGEGQGSVPRGMVFYTNILPQPPASALNVNPEIDLFFEYASKVLRDGIVETDAPELYGASGASVWEYVTATQGFWVPDKSVRVVAVQSAWLRGNYFRAVRWDAVASIMCRMDGELKAALEDRMIETGP